MDMELTAALHYARTESGRDLGLRMGIFGGKVIESTAGDRKNPVELTEALTRDELVDELRKLAHYQPQVDLAEYRGADYGND